MRFKKTSLFILTSFILCLPLSVLAADHGHQAEEMPEKTGIKLSPELYKLLNEEMTLIQAGMMNLVPSIAAGNWQEVVSISKKIKASYIMKQKITITQKEELHKVLPPGFIERDQAFHNAAGMLAHAAEKKNAEVVNFYFYKLNEACVSCHAKFATGRFPGLKKTEAEDDHHH